MDKEQNYSNDSDTNDEAIQKSNKDDFSLHQFTNVIENKRKTVFKCEQCSKESVKLFNKL